MTPDRPGTLDPDAVEQLLRDHLGRRADAAQPSLAPVAGITRRAGRRERRQVLLAGAAVVAMVAGGAVVAGPWLHGTSSRTLPATSTAPGPDGRWTVRDVPTRGDLAGSAAWLSALDGEVRALARITQTTVTMRNVLYAGHVQRGVLVVVAFDAGQEAGMPPDVNPRVLAFWSPTGVPGDLAQISLDGIGAGRIVASDGTPDDVVAVSVRTSDGSGYVVAVPLVPARTVTVSTGPKVGRDGSVRRSWQDAAVSDGAAVVPLDRAVPLQVPLVKVDGGRPWPVRRSPANSQTGLEAFAGETAQAWGIGSAPDPSVVVTALQALIPAVPFDRITVEPVFHGREQPSTSDVVAARVRLEDGSVLNVAAKVFDDINGTGRTQAVQALASGSPVPAATAATTPVAWLDDVSSAADGAVHARARMALPGAVRMEVRDVGATPCTKNRRLGSAAVDPNGLGTVVVDIPAACLTPVAPGDLSTSSTFPQVVAVALDADGDEMGRVSVQPWSPSDLVDTVDWFEAIAP